MTRKRIKKPEDPPIVSTSSKKKDKQQLQPSRAFDQVDLKIQKDKDKKQMKKPGQKN